MNFYQESSFIFIHNHAKVFVVVATAVVVATVNVEPFWIIIVFFLFADQIEILFNYICHSFYNCFCVSLSLLFSFLTLNTFYLVTKCDWMETEALSIHGDTLRSCILWKNGFAWRRGMACNEYKFQLVAILINAHTWFYIA